MYVKYTSVHTSVHTFNNSVMLRMTTTGTETPVKGVRNKYKAREVKVADIFTTHAASFTVRT